MASVIRFKETFSPLLREVAEINPRFDRSAISDMSEPVSFVPMANVSELTGSITSEVDRPISEVLRGFTPFRHGDVLVAKITPCFENGKITHAKIERRFGFGSTEFHVVRSQPDVLDGRYLYHFLRLERIRLQGERKMTGSAGQRRVPKHFLENLRIPLPPPAEQRRIAAILDKADALRAKRREAIAKLDQLLQSFFLEMFGAIKPDGHVVSDFANAAKGSIRTGPFGSQLLHSEFVDSGIAVLGIDNAVQNTFRWTASRFITEQKFDALRRFQVWPGDVLITIMGTCGRCAVVPDEVPTAINTKHLCCITLDQENCLPEFLHSYFLIHPAARQYLTGAAKGAIMSGLNMGIIKKLPVPKVSIAEQEKFVQAKHKIRDAMALHQRQLASLDELCLSLQQQTFIGQL